MSMKNSHLLKITGILIGIVLIIVLSVLFKLFVIGESVDGAQVNCTTSVNGHTLELRVAAVESAVALRGFRYKQEGDTLFISARKVVVSPLFDEGVYETSIDLELLDKIILGGQLIWSGENG